MLFWEEAGLRVNKPLWPEREIAVQTAPFSSYALPKSFFLKIRVPFFLKCKFLSVRGWCLSFTPFWCGRWCGSLPAGQCSEPTGAECASSVVPKAIPSAFQVSV